MSRLFELVIQSKKGVIFTYCEGWNITILDLGNACYFYIIIMLNDFQIPAKTSFPKKTIHL